MKKTMTSVTREQGVLKIVHPGGFVELHHSPVVAQKVMAKNPRHCVTRPDVFKFPWIVVRPESLLRPGNVYLIVPYRTIHRLVRSLAAASPPRTSSPIVSAQTPQQTSSTPCRARRVVVVEEMREESSSSVGRSSDARAGQPMIKSCLKKAGCSTTNKAHGKRVMFESPLKL